MQGISKGMDIRIVRKTLRKTAPSRAGMNPSLPPDFPTETVSILSLVANLVASPP
jgi:hypothetical protein